MDKIKPGDKVRYIGPDVQGVFIYNKVYKVESVQSKYDIISWINIILDEYNQRGHGYHARYWIKVKNNEYYLPSWF